MKKWILMAIISVLLTGCQVAKERDLLKNALAQKEQMNVELQGVIEEKSQRIKNLEQELTDLSAKLPQSWNEEKVLRSDALKPLIELHNDSLVGVYSPTYYAKLYAVFQSNPQAFILALKPQESRNIQDIIHQLFVFASLEVSEKEMLTVYNTVNQIEVNSLKEEYIQYLFLADIIAFFSNHGVTQSDLNANEMRITYTGSYYLHKLSLDLEVSDLVNILGIETLKREDELTQTAFYMYAIGNRLDYESDLSLDGADMIGLKNGDLSCQVFIWVRSGKIEEIQLYYMEGEALKTHTLSRNE